MHTPGCRTCAHQGQMPDLPPCSVCSRTYSLQWEPTATAATLIGIIQDDPAGVI